MSQRHLYSQWNNRINRVPGQVNHWWYMHDYFRLMWNNLEHAEKGNWFNRQFARRYQKLYLKHKLKWEDSKRRGAGMSLIQTRLDKWTPGWISLAVMDTNLFIFKRYRIWRRLTPDLIYIKGGGRDAGT